MRSELALQRALELGMSCFPCNEEKRPTCPHGFKDATADPEALRDLRRQHPGSLIGVPTGEVSGFDVLDIDPKHATAREWWAENRDDLMPTRAHRTRSGGLHLLFKYTPGLKCSAGKIAQGVDIRTTGGYVIWWPAAGFPILSNALPTDLPTWLHRLLLPPPRPQRTVVPVSHQHDRRALRGLIRTVATATEGQRNAVTFWAACRAGEQVRQGIMNESFVTECLLEAALHIGLPRAEAIRTIKSGLEQSS